MLICHVIVKSEEEAVNNKSKQADQENGDRHDSSSKFFKKLKQNHRIYFDCNIKYDALITIQV